MTWWHDDMMIWWFWPMCSMGSCTYERLARRTWTLVPFRCSSLLCNPDINSSKGDTLIWTCCVTLTSSQLKVCKGLQRVILILTCFWDFYHLLCGDNSSDFLEVTLGGTCLVVVKKISSLQEMSVIIIIINMIIIIILFMIMIIFIITCLVVVKKISSL